MESLLCRRKGASEREEPLMLIKFNFPLIVKKMTKAGGGDEGEARRRRRRRTGRRICGDRRKITHSHSVGVERLSNLVSGEDETAASPVLIRLAYLIKLHREFAYLNFDSSNFACLDN